MDLSLPRSLRDVVYADPISDQHGNNLYADWSVEFAPYFFRKNNSGSLSLHELANNQSYLKELKQHFYRPNETWPNLYNIVEGIVSAVSKPNQPASFIRDVIIGLIDGGGDGIGEKMQQNILQYRVLLSIIGIALIMAFVVVPLASLSIYCLIRRHYRHSYGYSPPPTPGASRFSSYHQPLRPLNVARAAPPYAYPNYEPSPPLGLCTLTMVSLLAATAGIFGIGSAFYFNNLYAGYLENGVFNLQRSLPPHLNMTIHEYVREFQDVGETLMEDFQHKGDFSVKVLESLKTFMTDANRIERIATQSGAFQVFVYTGPMWTQVVEALSDEIDIVNPATVSLAQLFAEVEPNFDRTGVDKLKKKRDLACQRFNTTSTTCNRNVPTNVDKSKICKTYMAPSFAKNVVAFSEAPVDNTEKAITYMNNLTAFKNEWVKQHLRNYIARNRLGSEFEKLIQGMSDELNDWVEHYRIWFSDKIELLTTKDKKKCSQVDDEERSTTTALMTTTTRKQTTSQRPKTTTTTSKPRTEEVEESSGFDTMIIERIFNDWYIVTATLLAIALLSTLLILGGCVCLMVVFCRNGSHFSRNFRARKATMLERVARKMLLGGSIIYVVLTCPLLSVIASTHFFAGGLVDNLVCKTIRSKNYRAIDATLNEDADGVYQSNILSHVVPPCYRAFVDSVDPRIISERVTIGRFLELGEGDKTLNALIQLDNTRLAQQIRHLQKMKTNYTRFTLWTPQIDRYMKEMDALLNSRSVLRTMMNNSNLTAAHQISLNLNTTAQCIFNFILRTTTSMSDEELDTLDEIAAYQFSLGQYVVGLPVASQRWSSAIDQFESLEVSRNETSASIMFTQNYFRTFPLLFREEIRYVVGRLFDNLFSAFAEDVGRLKPLWNLYDVIVREFACVQIFGAFNAIWLLLGIYLFFVGISVLFGFAVAGVLAGLRRDLEEADDGKDHWQTRGKFGNMAGWSMVPVTSQLSNDVTVQPVACLTLNAPHQQHYNGGFVIDNEAYRHRAVDVPENFQVPEVEMATVNTKRSSTTLTDKSSTQETNTTA